MHLNSRLNQYPSVACINHETVYIFFNVTEPLYPSKFHGNGKAFLFCTFFDMQRDNPLIRKLPAYLQGSH